MESQKRLLPLLASTLEAVLVYFFLSKVLDVAVDPLWWTAVLLGLTLWRLKKRNGALAELILVSTALSTLTLLSLPAISNRLWHSLEADAPISFRQDITYDTVVVLGGAVAPQGSLKDAPAWNDNVERLLEARRLMVEGRARRVLVTGGPLGGDLRPEAQYLAAALNSLGVPESAIIVEPKAKNTRENAIFTQALLGTQPAENILLITSAFHMRRARGCFRAAGLHPDTLPVDYRLRELDNDAHWLPRGDYFSQSTRALREWLGRFVYWILGYTA